MKLVSGGWGGGPKGGEPLLLLRLSAVLIHPCTRRCLRKGEGVGTSSSGAEGWHEIVGLSLDSGDWTFPTTPTCHQWTCHLAPACLIQQLKPHCTHRGERGKGARCIIEDEDGLGGISSGGGGGVDTPLWLDPPPKGAQLTDPPKSYRD